MSREDDAKIAEWLGELIPWTPPLGQENLAADYGFKWTDREFGQCRGWDYVKHYSSDDSVAIKLFPLLLRLGVIPHIIADTNSFDLPNGQWRCKLLILNGRAINAFAPTIAEAITKAVMQLIYRLTK